MNVNVKAKTMKGLVSQLAKLQSKALQNMDEDTILEHLEDEDIEIYKATVAEIERRFN